MSLVAFGITWLKSSFAHIQVLNKLWFAFILNNPVIYYIKNHLYMLKNREKLVAYSGLGIRNQRRDG